MGKDRADNQTGPHKNVFLADAKGHQIKTIERGATYPMLGLPLSRRRQTPSRMILLLKIRNGQFFFLLLNRSGPGGFF